jgi:hypothetical protein
MATYSEAELRYQVRAAIDRDADLRDIAEEAKRRKKRSLLENIVIDVARAIFGEVVGSLVRSVTDWLAKLLGWR